MFSLTQTHKTILLFTAGIMASMNGLFILLHSNGLGFDRFAKFSFISEPQDSLANTSLLVVVTTSLSTEEGYMESRRFYLDAIQRNFASLCEIGMTVRVKFTAYNDMDIRWKEYFNSTKGHCQREGSSFSLDLETFAYEKLPPEAFGTSGTLAMRHRDIFAREVENYDFFLIQEDDVNYTPENIIYLISNYRRMSRLRPSLFPNVFDSEMVNGAHYATFRMNAGYIFRLQQELYFSSIHVPGGRGYLLPRILLLRLIEQQGLHTFLNSQGVKGEFNPTIASGQAIMANYNLVHPLRNWKSGAIHHMSNKYIKLEMERNQSDVLSSLQFNELEEVFSSCYGPAESNKSSTTVSFEGSCWACLESGHASYMSTIIEGCPFSAERKVTFKFICEESENIRFPGRQD